VEERGFSPAFKADNMPGFSPGSMRLSPQQFRTFFVTAVTWSRRPLFRSERMTLLFLDVCEDNRHKGRFKIHEFVLMPDHFHLLITPDFKISLEKAVQFIKGGFSYRAKKEFGSNLEIWQPSFTEHRVHDAGDYLYHQTYIHENPVRAGLAGKPEDYPYSSAKRKDFLDPMPP
jgi:putative transposase